jgi:RNA polymerase sigma-70 factor (ECF subfamily)
MTESDEELIESANRGEADGFEALYLRYRDWVYRLAWRFAGNREDALDVLQETFAYLLGKFPGPAGRQARFKLTAAMTTFLYPVVKHLAIAAHNKSGRFSSDVGVLGEIVAPQSQQSGGSRADLAAVLATLPDDQREVVLMRFVDSMSLQEIADALDIPLGTVKSRLHNALNTLRGDRRTRDYFLE